jgi:hypothetical protein
MNFSWLLGLIILSQQVNMPGSLLITNNGDPSSIVNRTNFSMHPVLPIMDTEKFKTLWTKLTSS